MHDRLCPKCGKIAVRKFDVLGAGSLACRACGEGLRFRHGRALQLTSIFFVMVLLPSLLRLSPAIARLNIGMRVLIQLGIGLPIMCAAYLYAGQFFELELRRGADK